ncbi:MAG: hypothetical protein CI952_1324, partial [Methanohalophilus sp.]
LEKERHTKEASSMMNMVGIDKAELRAVGKVI